MKVYLWTNNEWKLYDSNKRGFQKELKKRNIIIGDRAEIGDRAVIGNGAKIGNWAEIGYGAKIGDGAVIGNGAVIGGEATIGDGAEIGYTPDIFSELNVLLMTGVSMINGTGTFYKAVKPDLTDFYTGKYQYKIGKGSRNNKLKRDQSIDCGKGWHWGSYWTAVAFLSKQSNGVIISATIKLKDILSVSGKYHKVRVKAFRNVQLVKMSAKEE